MMSSIVWELAQKSRREGYKEGYKEGYEEGRDKEKRNIAVRLMHLGLDMSIIMMATGLSSDDLQELQSAGIRPDVRQEEVQGTDG